MISILKLLRMFLIHLIPATSVLIPKNTEKSIFSKRTNLPDIPGRILNKNRRVKVSERNLLVN